MYQCEDAPCCGHEMGDCDGTLYGSDSDIQTRARRDWVTGHGYCEHAAGIYNCENDWDEDGV